MSTPDWVADATFYQIFPERFANGDPSLDPPGVVPWNAEPTRENFFGGDLAGITAHLDHIESLGANALYLTPIFEADTNHRYDAKDYFAIDHRLGDLAAFQTFLAAAHERGMRVVLDAVLNHCGDGHWAFRDVVEKERDSAYVNWFSVEGFPVTAHPVPNYRTCSGCYYLPKWNAYNPEVRDHHHRVARYWIEQGIDGWRLDVPYFINHSFWRGFREVVKEQGDDLYIVAEEWREPEEWLQGDLADGTMNYTLRDLVLGFTADRSVTAAEFAEGMNRLTDRIPEGYRTGMLNLLGSHDTERVLTRHGGDRAAALLAYTLLFSAEGAPMMYYGDEVGLVGENDPGCRGAMPWDESVWDAGLLAGVRALGAERRATPALRRGSQRVSAIGGDTVVVTRRMQDGETAVRIVNRGGAVEVPLTELPPLAAGESWGVAGDAVLVPAGSSVLLTARTDAARADSARTDAA
ncbi:glycoside hydrolase family 13 protein [Herbiconiux moechotypicola]|uniref:Glycoside hydrolase family 13 protein n=1 Tax=Herbiconiux moechotypicola TaxID=637393 RepID=A0ABN3DC43_9MICO|nr:glycoside hydrolase family 13 protein [Herbiconiux moechotypicola]MCS5728765.1 glycoside hydrolase family 13 protein [Herbiconiux moechotypicola]